MKKPGTNKLELMKYSPRVRKHTKHVEKKKGAAASWPSHGCRQLAAAS